jgi:3-hydroxyacyl-CoA dehydrogenase
MPEDIVVLCIAKLDLIYMIITAVAGILGKTPTIVNDFPVFVSNRVLIPLMNDAIYSL